MNNSARSEIEARRLQQASEWLIRLQEDDVADEEIVQWIDWCEAHLDNRKAFQDLLPLWEAFDDRKPGLQLSRLEKRLGMTHREGRVYFSPRLAIAASVLLA